MLSFATAIDHPLSTKERKLSGALLAKLATEALLQEASLTPKPALVDKRGSGAHKDLNISTMVRSALSLCPFFEEMGETAYGAELDLALRRRLGDCGRRAEQAMLSATQGSNAHRGAIWCLGLLLAATSMLQSGESTSAISQLAAELARIPDERANGKLSHGEIVRNSFGRGGAREEAEAGFPHVVAIALPFLHERRATGRNERTCQIDTLLAIMSDLDDSCLLYRGGMEALKVAQEGARAVLDLGGHAEASGRSRLHQLECALLKRNASPGGSADLLAATIFLDQLQTLT